ncbi:MULTISPECIES: DUF6891 domain-containing protein [unclassified Streptomyces]|uniref:DUF6891 domain-containing protein n=1 Tax=unclassified Streptomyces TaxID=2593676 RepID=UPI00382AB58B
MLAITVLTEPGPRHLRPSAGELAALVHRIGREGDRFLVVETVPDLPDVFVQVWHRSGGDYILEHRAGSPERHFGTSVDGPEAVIAAMTAWADGRRDGWDAGRVWERVEFPPVQPAPPLELDEEERVLLENRIREVLAGGYTTRARLTELAEDYLVSGDHRPVSRAQAEALADRMWLERVEEQTGWAGETDPERLSRAFAELDAAGITARENFTCCRSCGEAEIGAEGGPDARGFVYFHDQCTDSATAGHGLTLLYGGFDGTSATTAAVGREVVTALTRAGLPTRWDGDPGQSITVTPLTWHRRLVG